jgi:hypothetical protein
MLHFVTCLNVGKYHVQELNWIYILSYSLIFCATNLWF